CLDDGDRWNLRQIDLDRAVERALFKQGLSRVASRIAILELEIAEARMNRFGADPTVAIGSRMCIRVSGYVHDPASPHSSSLTTRCDLALVARCEFTARPAQHVLNPIQRRAHGWLAIRRDLSSAYSGCPPPAWTPRNDLAVVVTGLSARCATARATTTSG